MSCCCPFVVFVISAGGSGENKENRGELPTPSSTPTSVRKNRRRSNLFTPSAKGKEKFEEKKPGEVRVISSPAFLLNLVRASGMQL